MIVQIKLSVITKACSKQTVLSAHSFGTAVFALFAFTATQKMHKNLRERNRFHCTLHHCCHYRHFYFYDYLVHTHSIFAVTISHIDVWPGKHRSKQCFKVQNKYLWSNTSYKPGFPLFRILHGFKNKTKFAAFAEVRHEWNTKCRRQVCGRKK